MNKSNTINYIELPAVNMTATKDFFTEVFGWEFEDYGPEYMAFSKSGIDGGFYKSQLKCQSESGGALIVLYDEDLETAYSKVVNGGGEIVKEIFSFPGGRRFQFLEPSGNEFAIWSDN